MSHESYFCGDWQKTPKHTKTNKTKKHNQIAHMENPAMIESQSLTDYFAQCLMYERFKYDHSMYSLFLSENSFLFRMKNLWSRILHEGGSSQFNLLLSAFTSASILGVKSWAAASFRKSFKCLFYMNHKSVIWCWTFTGRSQTLTVKINEYSCVLLKNWNYSSAIFILCKVIQWADLDSLFDPPALKSLSLCSLVTIVHQMPSDFICEDWTCEGEGLFSFVERLNYDFGCLLLVGLFSFFMLFYSLPSSLSLCCMCVWLCSAFPSTLSLHTCPASCWSALLCSQCLSQPITPSMHLCLVTCSPFPHYFTQYLSLALKFSLCWFICSGSALCIVLKMKSSHTAGVDNICSKILKAIISEIVEPLVDSINLSLLCGVVPDVSKNCKNRISV